MFCRHQNSRPLHTMETTIRENKNFTNCMNTSRHLFLLNVSICTKILVELLINLTHSDKRLKFMADKYNTESGFFLVTIKLYTGLTMMMKAACSSEMLVSTYSLHAVTTQKTTTRTFTVILSITNLTEIHRVLLNIKYKNRTYMVS
jgi:hypothetical protein